MKYKVNVYEKVARIARSAASEASPAEIADAIVSLERIALRTKRLYERKLSEPGYAERAVKLLDAWQRRADAVASRLGFLAKVGDMGYVALVDPIEGMRIATFG